MHELTLLEKIEAELHELGVIVLQKNINEIKGFTLKNDKQTYLIINKNSIKYAINFRTSLLAHEHGHIMTNAFYDFDTSLAAIKRRECKANDYAVKKWINYDIFKQFYLDGLEIWEIADILNLDEDLIKHAIYYYKRKGML